MSSSTSAGSRQPVTWTKGTTPVSLASAETASMPAQSTGGQSQTGAAAAQRRIAARSSSAAACSGLVDREAQELKSTRGNDLEFESGSQFDALPDSLDASDEGDDNNGLLVLPEDADGVRDDQDCVSWTSSGLTSPTRTGSPENYTAGDYRYAHDAAAMDSFVAVLPTFGLGDKALGVAGPCHMQLDADMRLDGDEGLGDPGSGMPRMEIRAVGGGNANAMQSARVINGSLASNSSPMAHAVQAPAGKSKRTVRQHKATTIATWPSHAGELCKGVNDTWNSFQRLHKGRSVTSAEWKAARSLLWSMAAEAAAHAPQGHQQPAVAAGGYFY